MFKLQILFISGGLLMVIFANVANATCQPPQDSDAAKLAQVSADASSDIGSLAICLARLSCDPTITKAIYAVFDHSVESGRRIPKGVSNAEYMKLDYEILLLAIEKLKAISEHCAKIPFPCNNLCRGQSLDAPQEVTDVGNVLTGVAPLVKCLLAKNDPVILDAMPLLFVDAVKRLTAATCTSDTSVGLVKKEIEIGVLELRKIDEKCAKVKAVNNNCVCGCSSYKGGCGCGCGP